MTAGGTRVYAVMGLLLGALALVGWLDYRATSRELRALVRTEGDTLYATIAAAARVQHAAATAAEKALGQRLLEQARLLAAMDRGKTLDEAALAPLAASPDVFRVVVFGADGRREIIAGETPRGAGRGPGGGVGAGRGPRDGRGAGFGAGPPAGASRVAQRLLSGEAEEILSDARAGPGGGERIAAGVRRASGGAIVINAANELARELDEVYSLDALVSQIATATPALGYVILEDEHGRIARGPLAEHVGPRLASLPEGELMTAVGAVPVLERRGTIALDEARTTGLRIGMRLEEVQRAERSALIRIGGALGAFAALAILAVAFGALRTRYGDLSERHAHAQEALRRRDRLAAMGEMASTVAHEIRNPLNAIAMSAQRLAREYPPAAGADGAFDEAGELVDVIQRESSRIDGTVQQFLEFARPRAINPRDISLSDLLEEASDAASSAAGARQVRITVESGPSIRMSADPDQLRQAIDNLVRNAVDATPPGGSITLVAARKGKRTEIQVRDTGAGIPADVLPRMFDLYFTTKRSGTGVGLAIVQQIVNAHGGTIAVDSRPGDGTTVTIDLPREGVPRA